MRILYEDNHLLVVDKPAGLLSQGDSSGDETVLDQAKAYLKVSYKKPGEVFLGLVHRIDRPVSGVLVLARTSKAASRLTSQFKSRTVQKQYVAVVVGYPDGPGECRDHVLKTGRKVSIVGAEKKDAREAVLHWTHLLADGDGRHLLLVEPKTGRPHQIRVQLATRGASILGDYRYGPGIPLDGKNIALHCARMVIEHPTRKEAISFSALPPDFWPKAMRRASEEWLARQPILGRD